MLPRYIFEELTVVTCWAGIQDFPVVCLYPDAIS